MGKLAIRPHFDYGNILYDKPHKVNFNKKHQQFWSWNNFFLHCESYSISRAALYSTISKIFLKALNMTDDYIVWLSLHLSYQIVCTVYFFYFCQAHNNFLCL